MLLHCQCAIGSSVLNCSQPVPKCIRITRRSALSLLAGHDIGLNRPLVVAHFGSNSGLAADQGRPSGIRFVPGNLIRFHGRFSF